jgi:hypothetical protein
MSELSSMTIATHVGEGLIFGLALVIGLVFAIVVVIRGGRL